MNFIRVLFGFTPHNLIFVKNSLMIKEKLIKVRKEKKFSQQDIAEHLNISQSHYQRKEKGEISITNNEWERIANLFETDVEEIKENDEATNVMNNFDNSSGNFGNNNTNSYYNVPEFLLESQLEYISFLKEENRRLKEENESLKEELKNLRK
jgi:transcriptional regulator with XRE-family HTH domain